MAEVASAFVTIIPSFKGGSRAISNELGGSVDKAGRDSGRRFGGGMATGVGAVATKVFAPLAAAAAGAGIASFFGDAVSAASDLNEAGTKTEAIFGKAGAAMVQAFAGKGAKALGQTRLEVVNAAATFGTFGKAAGKSGKDLAEFSTGFAGLSTDLASFYNTSPEEAVEAIGAALRGEAEPIRKYGVLLDDATLRQEALRQGLIKTTKQALTPQQKVLAAQAVIYKQTKDAQGDFARTSGGLANQQRILKAQFEDFKGTVGQALLPVVTRFVTFLNDKMVPTFQQVGRFVRPAVDAFEVFKAALSGGEVTTVGPLGRVGDAAYGIRDAFAAAQPLIAQVTTFLREKLIPAVSGVVTAFRGYITTIIPIVRQFVAGFRENVGPLAPQARKIFGQIGDVVVSVMGLIQAIIQRVTQVVSFIWSRWGKQITALVSNAFKTVVGVIGGALNIVAGIIKTVTAIIRGDWSGAWDGIKQIVRGAWDIIKSVVKGAIGQVAAFFDPGLLYQAGQKLINGLIDGIKSKIRAVGDAVAGVAQKVKDFFPGSPVKSGPLRSWNNGGAGKRLGDQLASGLEASQRRVSAASRSLAASVSDPTAGGRGDGSGRLDLSESSVQRIAAAMSNRPNYVSVSAGQVDRALAVGL